MIFAAWWIAWWPNSLLLDAWCLMHAWCFTVHGSKLMAQGSWPRVAGWAPRPRGAPGPGPDICGGAPTGSRAVPAPMRHEPWTMSHEPRTLNNRLINSFSFSKLQIFKFWKSQSSRMLQFKICKLSTFSKFAISQTFPEVNNSKVRTHRVQRFRFTFMLDFRKYLGDMRWEFLLFVEVIWWVQSQE